MRKDLIIRRKIKSLDDIKDSLKVMGDNSFSDKQKQISNSLRYKLKEEDLAEFFEQDGITRSGALELLESLELSLEAPARHLSDIYQHAESLPEEELLGWIRKKDTTESLKHFIGLKRTKEIKESESKNEILDIILEHTLEGNTYEEELFIPKVRKPKEIVEYLDEYVISQDEAKKDISILFYNHLRRIKDLEEGKQPYNVPNSFLIGSTGVGKTYMVEKAAEFTQVPFVLVDSAGYSAPGYIGENMEAIHEKIISEIGDLRLAQYAVVLFDEIDKKRRNLSNEADVSGSMVQDNLLKIIEGKNYILSDEDFKDEIVGLEGVDCFTTRNILFLFAGAFMDIKKQFNTNPIGIESSIKSVTDFSYSRVMHKDLIEYGMIPELIRRAPVISTLRDLSVDDLEDILKHSKDSPLRPYIERYSSEGIELRFNERAIRHIAKEAHKQNIGASSLQLACYDIMKEFDYCIPDIKGNIENITIDKEICKDAKSYCKMLAEKADANEAL